MKPVYQTIFGDPGGNCWSACVATLLELTIEQVPNLHAEHGFDWIDPFKKWLRPFGLFPVVIGYPKDSEELWMKEGPMFIAGGRSFANTSHACIYQGRNLIHDPFPGKTGIRRQAGLVEIEDMTFMVPLKFDFKRFSQDLVVTGSTFIVLE